MPSAGDEAHHRAELRLDACQREAAAQELRVGGAERRLRATLHRVRAHDRHARQVLLHHARQGAELGLLGSVPLVTEELKRAGEHDDETGYGSSPTA
jgi:hypothetical protein